MQPTTDLSKFARALLLAVSLGRVRDTRLESLEAVAEVLTKARDEFHPYTQREASLPLPV